MPIVRVKKDRRKRHRPRVTSGRRLLFNAVVARPVGRKEIAVTKKAQDAQSAEWGRLRDREVWDETVIREWSAVASEAQKKKKEVNFGYLFGICVEKGSELPAGHLSRKFKYRVVFQ